MKIAYATAHRWVKPVPAEPLDSFGKNAQERLRATLSKVAYCAIRNEVRPLDEHFLNTFIPLYEERIRAKEHGVIFDIREKTLGNPARRFPYFSMSLYEEGAFIGGTIFSVRTNTLAVAYRIYRNDWNSAPLRANPSLYTEYCLNEYARSVGSRYILHGKDRNPYGLNSGIGLAGFKLSAGCYPEKSKTFELRELDTDDLTEDALILEYPKDDTATRITHAYLLTTRESEQRWIQVTKYPHLLSVEVLYRKT